MKDTRTADVDESLRFLRKLKAEHPGARAQRIEADKVTLSDALVNLGRDRKDRGVWVQRALFGGLDLALGHLKLADLPSRASRRGMPMLAARRDRVPRPGRIAADAPGVYSDVRARHADAPAGAPRDTPSP